jgi:putative RNA 2'-phosphotransferase
MTSKIKQIGRWITFVLRHQPCEINLTLNRAENSQIIDINGYVLVSDLLEAAKIKLSDLNDIVAADGKQRFAFSNDKLKIRANQGHSTPLVNLELDVVVPPDILYHGTGIKFLKNIKKEGLKIMNRHHVHLSSNIETATQVGNRHGECFIIKVDAKQMIKDGIDIYLSENKVWLTADISTKYLINI